MLLREERLMKTIIALLTILPMVTFAHQGSIEHQHVWEGYLYECRLAMSGNEVCQCSDGYDGVIRYSHCGNPDGTRGTNDAPEIVIPDPPAPPVLADPNFGPPEVVRPLVPGTDIVEFFVPYVTNSPGQATTLVIRNESECDHDYDFDFTQFANDRRRSFSLGADATGSVEADTTIALSVGDTDILESTGTIRGFGELHIEGRQATTETVTLWLRLAIHGEGTQALTEIDPSLGSTTESERECEGD